LFFYILFPVPKINKEKLVVFVILPHEIKSVTYEMCVVGINFNAVSNSIWQLLEKQHLV